MLNVAMSMVLLVGTGINTFIGKIKTAGMPEHMGMNRKRETCDLSGPQHNMANPSCGQRAAPFRDKQIGRIWVVSVQLSESPKFWTAYRVERRFSILDPVDMQETGLEIDRIPTQRHHFGHSQTMAVHEENKRRITAGMAAHLSSCGNNLIDFTCGQIFP